MHYIFLYACLKNVFIPRLEITDDLHSVQSQNINMIIKTMRKVIASAPASAPSPLHTFAVTDRDVNNDWEDATF